MPKEAHKNLVKQANKKGLTGKRRDKYIYGTLEKIKKGK